MQVNLSWQAVPNCLFYRIYRGVQSGGPYVLAGTSNPNPGQIPTPNNSQVVTTFQDGPGNLVNGQDYYYVVTAVTPDGETAYSSEFHAAPPSAGSIPSGVSGVVI